MIVKKSTWRLGVPIIIIGLLFFLAGYVAWLVVVLQDLYVTRNLVNNTRNLPPLIPFLLLAIIDGLLLGTFLYVGYSLSTLQDDTSRYGGKITFNDLITSKGFITCVVLTIVAAIAIMIVWRNNI